MHKLPPRIAPVLATTSSSENDALSQWIFWFINHLRMKKCVSWTHGKCQFSKQAQIFVLAFPIYYAESCVQENIRTQIVHVENRSLFIMPEMSLWKAHFKEEHDCWNENMLEEVKHNSVQARIHPLLRVWQAHLSTVLFPYAGNCVPVPISMTSSAFSWGHAINSLTLKLSQKCHYELNSENCLSFRGHTVPVEKR